MLALSGPPGSVLALLSPSSCPLESDVCAVRAASGVSYESSQLSRDSREDASIITNWSH